MDSVCAGDTSLQISRTRINGPSSQSQAKQALKQKLPRYLEGRRNVGFVATTAVPSLGKTSRERRHWSHGDTKAQRVTFLSNRLIGDSPIDTFAANCEKTFLDWIKLLSRATIPEDIQSTDPRIISAFKAVDSVICGQGINALQRLAHVQLLRLFDLLEAIVKTDRVTGRIHRERHYQDHHIAMDIYMSAQEAHSNTNYLRTKIRTCRKRLSKRWSVLARASPLFVDCKKIDNRTLNLAATRTLETCPHQLVRICARLASIADAAARSNHSLDMRMFSAAQIRHSLCQVKF
ncbi:hypothetical protein F5883DRAFT_437035 [Diaporthe sp. PMI_573]|nr:hypothetical protein F5883DRAFT_437035 [Diaporthaceae sp. PMI_573]